MICLLPQGGCGPVRPDASREQASGRDPAPGERGEREAEPQTGHQRMLGLLAHQKEVSQAQSPLFGDADLREREWALEHFPLGVVDRFNAHYASGMAALRLGQNQKAVDHLQEAFILVHKLPPQTLQQNEGLRLEVLLHLASACLRLGETENCVHCQTSASCIFPIAKEGVHQDKTGSQMAAKYLTQYLAQDADDATARWLLNIAHMTLGDYPDAVPAKYRIPAERFESEVAFPRFVNVSSDAGLNTESLSGGVIVDDFDGDHRLDVVVSDWSDAGQLRFFHNLGGRRFEERTEQAGIVGLYGGLNLLQADYDNDGDLDVLVLRGAWRGGEGTPLNSLLQNDGHGHFRDMTFESGLGDTAYPTQTAGWADYDNDGDLDLYVGNERFACQLYENNGKGQFQDVAARAGVENKRFTKGVTWGDYDNDGDPDIYVSNYGTPGGGQSRDRAANQFTAREGEPNRLYRNNGDGTFTDVAEQLGVSKPLLSFPAWFWDFNNDGALDLFVATFDGTIQEVAAEYLEGVPRMERPCLYQGDGQGGFQEVARQCRLDRPSLTMGANFGDLNNDGFLDVYLGTGHPPYEALMPNLMFLNQQGTTFADVTTAGGFGHLQKGHGIAMADVDNDGDQDIFSELGGAYPGDTAVNALFENPGFGNHWLCCKLVGRQSNRCAIGARLHLVVEDQGQLRDIYRWVGSGGSFGANPLRQEIGLGKAETIKRLEVYWPKTGQTQTFEDVAADQFLEIQEGNPALRPLLEPGSADR